jgi:hypothetical protein
LAPRPESDIQLANRIVPLTLVLSWNGIYVPEFTYGRSVKARCPYADMYHLDSEASKSMRVYSDTNTGNCFMGCGTITPVSVFARMNDLPYREAAKELLSRVGHRRKTFQEEWNEAVDPEDVFSSSSYRDALLEFCWSKSKGQWSSMQYDARISSALSNTLTILDLADSSEAAKKWLHSSKIYMYGIIREFFQ